MNIRTARPGEASSIAQVARASLRESYGSFIDGETIDTVVDEWYATDEVGSLIEAEDALFLVAVDADEVVGFAQAFLLDEEPLAGEIHWLHVTPDARGQGTGEQLFARAQDELEDRGAEIVRGLVLAKNVTGTSFYEDRGFDQVATKSVDIDRQTFDEYVFEKQLGDEIEEAVVQAITTADGETIHVNYSDAERGALAPFYAAYSDSDLHRRYGWFCGNCESPDTAMDSMGRIECNQCGNKRKATRWDASYL
jgi:ribosomal protein S18 acetylase RimI-like enzyme